MNTMNSILLSAIALATTAINFTSNAQETDPVKKANESNEIKADKDMVDEDIADFLVKSADARMMDTREGKLAVQKGTTAAIRNYGEWMVKDQPIILNEIKKLAAKRNITMPTDISDKKEEGQEKLANKEDEKFDEKFIKMMIIDHERDVKLFKKAIDCNDKEVSEFAKKYLPVIQSHLDKINAIKSQTK